MYICMCTYTCTCISMSSFVAQAAQISRAPPCVYSPCTCISSFSIYIASPTPFPPAHAQRRKILRKNTDGLRDYIASHMCYLFHQVSECAAPPQPIQDSFGRSVEALHLGGNTVRACYHYSRVHGVSGELKVIITTS